MVHVAGADVDHVDNVDKFGAGFLRGVAAEPDRRSYADLVAQCLVVALGNAQELFHSTPLIPPLLLQQHIELELREGSRASQAIACGRADAAEVVGHADHVVELNLLTVWSVRACARMANPRSNTSASIRLGPPLAGGVDELTHCLGGHQEARGEGIGTDLAQLGAVLPTTDQAPLGAIDRYVTVLVCVWDPSGQDIVLPIRGDQPPVRRRHERQTGDFFKQRDLSRPRILPFEKPAMSGSEVRPSPRRRCSSMATLSPCWAASLLVRGCGRG